MGINVLSCFDGCSGGNQALERIGIKVDNYFASEIDKYAIQVTMANYPNTIQLGSVVDVDCSKLPKIDLLIGGSPCQSFSFAGKRKGMSTKCETEILTLEHYLELKSDGFEFEGQSYLFWEYMRILNEVKPKYFLLENVEMGEKWEKVLSKAIGVNGIHINSALVSAQNRKRIYWFNFGIPTIDLFGETTYHIPQPKDKGILLKDILDSEVDEKYFLSEKMLKSLMADKDLGNGVWKGMETRELFEKGHTITARMGKSDNYIKIDKKGNVKDNQEKASCFTAGGHSGGNHSDMDLIVHNTMPRSSTTGKGGTGHLSRNDGKTYCLDTGNTNAVEIVAMRGRGEKGNIEQQLKTNGTDKSNSLTTAQKDNLVRQLNPSTESNGKQPYQQNRIYDIEGISPALMAQLPKGSTMINTSRIRRLTPTECEKLQTMNPGYTKKGLENHFQLFNFTGNKFTLCQRFVKKKIVTNQFQVEKLNYATNTIIDLLETEQLNYQDHLLTTLKNVSWMVVNESNNLQQKRVLCTIKDGKDMGHLLFPKELINQNLNVSFVIRKLEGQEALECVTNISKCSDYMETHYIPTKEGLLQTHTDIIEIPMESNFTEKLLNKKLVENLLRESKSYIILTLIKLIITQAIYKSLQNQNTPVHINSLIKLQDNSLELELLYIETENIVSISDSMRYKMIGNGWTISVIAHIFSYLNLSSETTS